MILTNILVFLSLIANFQIGIFGLTSPGRNNDIYEFTQERPARSLDDIYNFRGNSLKLNGVDKADVAREAGGETQGRAARPMSSRSSSSRRRIVRSPTVANCGVTGDQIDQISSNKVTKVYYGRDLFFYIGYLVYLAVLLSWL